MKAYLTKWIPPRPDFLQTITDEEKALFHQHGDWQTELRKTRQIVAHGPVVDPIGPYGVALWEIEDDVDIAALTAEDPIMKAGIGRYEHFPMTQLRTRE
ncbi:YciI family protein [Agrobacterium sp. 16-172Ci]